MGVRQPGTHLQATAAPEANGATPFFREASADDELLLAVIESAIVLVIAKFWIRVIRVMMYLAYDTRTFLEKLFSFCRGREFFACFCGEDGKQRSLQILV